MENTSDKNQQHQSDTNDQKSGFIEPLPHEHNGPGENDRARLNQEDAGGTGPGHTDDHGKRDREIRKQ